MSVDSGQVLSVGQYVELEENKTIELIEKTVSIVVFEINDTTFEQVGEISQFTSLIWPDAFNGYASFELWAPLTDDNIAMIKKDNVLWCGGENACVIEIVKSTVDNKGEKGYNIKGRTLEAYLLDRIVWGTYTNKSAAASTIMYDLVYTQAINPSNPDRKLNWLVNASDSGLGKQISNYQKTGGWVYDALVSIATDSDIGFSILFDPYNKQLVFEVRAGTDRTQDNVEGNDPVVFSAELEDILSSSYYSNNQDEKNVALVMGEDKSTNRKSVVAGNSTSKGFSRKELYVDARDIQSEVYNDDGTSTQIPTEEYNNMLLQRGAEKLAECELVETYEAQIKQFGIVQYVYGVDYVKGDKVTVIDTELGISVSARITKVEEDIDTQYALVLTFGYSYPTILQKMQRMTT